MAKVSNTKLDAIAPKIERPKSKRGRKPIVKPELVELAKAWPNIPTNEDRGVPGTLSLHSHEELTLARYHLKKTLNAFGISKGDYETFSLDTGGLGFRKLR